MERFEQSKEANAPPHRLSTFDWVKEKASEYRTEAGQYLAGKSKTELALDGAVVAVGVAASFVAHRNLLKSGIMTETLSAVNSDKRLAVGLVERLEGNAAARNLNIKIPQPPAPPGKEVLVFPKPVNNRHFALPEGLARADIPTKPPIAMPTEILPWLGDHDYDKQVAERFNIRLELENPYSIGILHSRFRNLDKQLEMLQSSEHNLSLYGNRDSGIGVLEYELKPSVRGYFKNADSVVQIKFWGKSHGVGTGTLISHDGLVATAGHVVPGSRKITVDTLHGQFEAKVVAKNYNSKNDVAAIQLLGVPRDLKFPVPAMTSEHLVPRMRAATIGHPQGLSGQYASVGSYLNKFDFTTDGLTGEHPAFLLDTVLQGHSGGPIFDKHGNFSAIVANRFLPSPGTALELSHRGIVYGNRIEDLLAVLKEKRIPYGN